MSTATKERPAAEPVAQEREQPAGLLDQILERQAEAAARYQPILSVKQFSEREKALMELKAILARDTDFGVVPGTSGKPTLFKPGAEKINTFFGYVPHYEVDKIEDWTGREHGGEPLFYYRYTCTLLKDGKPVGEGQGSCSSWESKYRWRTGSRKCPACGQEAIIKGKAEYGGGWVCLKKKDGCGAKYRDGDRSIEGQEVGRRPNADIYDLVNTLQKMGQKRAYIAATLSATGASQYFTQDLEDFHEGDYHEAEPPPARRPQADAPSQARAPSRPEPPRTAERPPQPAPAPARGSGKPETGRDLLDRLHKLEDAGLAEEGYWLDRLDTFRAEQHCDPDAAVWSKQQVQAFYDSIKDEVAQRKKLAEETFGAAQETARLVGQGG